MSHRTAFVTGATEGIGRAIAFALGRAGWQVGVCARTPASVDALVAALAAEGIRAAGHPADVGDEHQVPAAVRHIEAALGPVDTLVNNAGMAVVKPFADFSLEEWDATMRTNVRSLFLVTREVLPGMRERKAGTIVNIASLAARNGTADLVAYSASKHAVLGFSRSLMMEVRKDGVRVIAICPGSVDTRMIREHSNPSRILQPDDVAQAVLTAVTLPPRALLSELDLRPTNP